MIHFTTIFALLRVVYNRIHNISEVSLYVYLCRLALGIKQMPVPPKPYSSRDLFQAPSYPHLHCPPCADYTLSAGLLFLASSSPVLSKIRIASLVEDAHPFKKFLRRKLQTSDKKCPFGLAAWCGAGLIQSSMIPGACVGESPALLAAPPWQVSALSSSSALRRNVHICVN